MPWCSSRELDGDLRGAVDALWQVQTLLSFVRGQENAPPIPDRAETRILRGLLYVHLYAAFEFAVNRIIAGAIDVVNREQLPHCNVSHNLGALVLNGAFNACRDAAAHKRWVKRVDLINLRISSQVASIPDDCLVVQNIWPEALEDTFAVFGINKPVMYDMTKGGYIRELVDARNKISHGEISPQAYGTLKRSDELQTMYDAIRNEAFYLLDCFDEYLSSQSYRLTA